MNKRLIKVFFISSLIFSPQFSFGQSDSDESVEEMVVTATFRETTVTVSYTHLRAHETR